MGLVSDAQKALALVRRAVASRSAVQQRPAHRSTALPPHPPHHYRVAVYFADGAVNMYQMRQWYKPLAELAKTWPVVVLSRVATGAQALLAEDAPPVAFVPTVRDVEAFIADQDIRVVLYVNQNTRNFQMFRYGRRWHVFINHGESDKMYMTTNQYKAYDYAFVAGQAARERLGRVLWDYDIDRRTIEIGRPQADHYSGDAAVHARRAHGRALRARPGRATARRRTTARSSRHGEALVPGAARHRHAPRHLPPASAQRSREPRVRRRQPADHRRARGSQRRRSAGAPRVRRRPGAGLAARGGGCRDRRHLGDGLRPARRRQAAAGDAARSTPRRPSTRNGYLQACEWLDAASAPSIVGEVARVLGDEAATARLAHWVTHYFGDTSPGAATAKFHAAIERLMAEWEAWHDRALEDDERRGARSRTRPSSTTPSRGSVPGR